MQLTTEEVARDH